MGRKSTGSITLGEASPLRISDLLAWGLLRKGRTVEARIELIGGIRATIITALETTAGTLDIALDGPETNPRPPQRVGIVSRPSNLGQGHIFYFLCPSTGRRVRALYKLPGSDTWESMYSYRGGRRIYYPAQRYSKLQRTTEGYYRILSRLESESNPERAEALRQRLRSYSTYRLSRLLRRLSF